VGIFAIVANNAAAEQAELRCFDGPFNWFWTAFAIVATFCAFWHGYDGTYEAFYAIAIYKAGFLQ